MAKTRSEIKQAIRDSRQWTVEQAAVVLAATEESGLSMRRFAVRHRLDPQRLTRWRSQRLATGTHGPSLAPSRSGPCPCGCGKKYTRRCATTASGPAPVARALTFVAPPQEGRYAEPGGVTNVAAHFP